MTKHIRLTERCEQLETTVNQYETDKFSAFHFSASTVIISIITLSMVILGGIFHFRLLDSYGIAFIFAPLRAVSQGIVVIFRRAHAAFDRLFVN